MDDAPKFVSANGLRFAYFEEGEGPLVLLVHGFPDTAHSWDLARAQLARAGYRAVSPFTRGYAPTEVPSTEDFGAETLGRDVLALIEALGEKKAVVVGHDWGASAAYAAASIAPERLEMMITVSIPHPAGVLPTPKVLWAVRHFLSLRRSGAAEMVRRNHFAHLDELWKRWSPAWDVPSSETEAVKKAFSSPGSLEAALGYYRALRPWLPKVHMKRVTVPSVAFAGNDDIISPSQFDRAASRYNDKYEVVRMPGGHFMHREHPDRFNSELLRVLDAHFGRSKKSPS